MKNQQQNSNLFNNNPRKIKVSSKKHLKTIEESPESEDIIKKLENMNFSTEKSFETPFISLSKTKDKIINQINNLNKSISNPNLFIENYEDIPSDMKFLKEEETNDSNYIDMIAKFLGDEGKKGNSNINCGVDNHLLKEKINRIYMLIQKCNMNKNCLDKMNKFMNSVNNLSQNSYQPLDFILDVVSELLSKIQEEYSNKNELINKLKNISLNKENYEKQIFEIKYELQNKEKQLEKLMDNDTIENINSKKEINQDSLLFMINNAKKENQFLFEKILSYKIQNKNILSGFKNLFEKYKNSLEEIEKLKNKNNQNLLCKTVASFEINARPKIIKSSSSCKNIHINRDNYNITNNNKVYSLTNKLIKLLSDINQMLFKCDFNLCKINKTYKASLNDIKEINPIIDINFLLQGKNFLLFSKYISCNIEIINNKIINLSNSFPSSNSRNTKENKNFSFTLKNKTELVNNSSLKRLNPPLKFYCPKSKDGSKTINNYINLKKTRNHIINQKLMRNSTSRDGLSYMNFYNNNDLENIPVLRKNGSNGKNIKLINQTVNLEKQRYKKQNDSEFD